MFIVQTKFKDQFSYKSSTEGYQLKSFKKDYFDSIGSNVERTYFTTDPAHLERFHKRWQGSYKAFVFQNNQFISLKELEEKERKKQELLKSQQNEQERARKGGSESIIQQLTSQNSDIHARLDKATKAYQDLEKKSRTMLLSALIGVVILLALNLVQFFNTPEDKIEIPIQETVLPTYHFDNFNELEKAFLDSLLIDTNKMEVLNPLLKSDYLFMTKQIDTTRLNNLLENVKLYNSESYSKIDTNFIVKLNNN